MAEPRLEPPGLSTALELLLTAKVANLERGLVTRTLIGQAQGILIERYKMTAEAAFEMLVTASSTTNRKLRDIASDLVTTGEVPGPAAVTR